MTLKAIKKKYDSKNVRSYKNVLTSESQREVSYLSFNQPARNGGFAIIARFELQGDGAGADVRNT